jgi:Na+-transporting NADH:ubiquinone oxidoreductase subunit NqrF
VPDFEYFMSQKTNKHWHIIISRIYPNENWNIFGPILLSFFSIPPDLQQTATTEKKYEVLGDVWQ